MTLIRRRWPRSFSAARLRRASAVVLVALDAAVHITLEVAGAHQLLPPFFALQPPGLWHALQQMQLRMRDAPPAWSEDASVRAMLEALALVSRTLREPSLCAKLRANSDPATLYTIVTEAQAAQAA